MKTTISVIKADVGSIGGHIKPSAKLKAAIEQHVRDKGKKLLIDLYVSSTGDDTALLMSHDRGVNDPKIHLRTDRAEVSPGAAELRIRFPPGSGYVEQLVTLSW